MRTKIAIAALVICAAAVASHYFYGVSKAYSNAAERSENNGARIILTSLFASAKAGWAEDGRYPAALTDLKLDPALTQKYNVQYKVGADGQSFAATAEVNGATWSIDESMNIVESPASGAQ